MRNCDQKGDEKSGNFEYLAASLLNNKFFQIIKLQWNSKHVLSQKKVSLKTNNRPLFNSILYFWLRMDQQDNIDDRKVKDSYVRLILQTEETMGDNPTGESVQSQ